MSKNFSEYFDPKFNFTNNIQEEDNENKNVNTNMKCNDNIMLEPRLQEYLKRKRFYKENNIDSGVSPEKEYQITPFDKKILRSFLKGDRTIYEKNNDKFNKRSEKSMSISGKFASSVSELMNDPRVPAIDKINGKGNNNINQNQKQQQENPINRGMFVPDNKYGRYYEDPHVKTESRNQIYHGRDLSDKKMQSSNFDSIGTFNNLSKQARSNQHNVFSNSSIHKNFIDPDPRNKNIISNLFEKANRTKKEINEERGMDNSASNYGSFCDLIPQSDYQLIEEKDKWAAKSEKRYGEEAVPVFSSLSTMDFENKIVMPSMGYKSKRDLNPSEYRFATFGDDYNCEVRDTDLESDMLMGLSSKTMKSYGYNNPNDHYFDFIDEKELHKSSEIEPFERGGVSARLENHKMLNRNNKSF